MCRVNNISFTDQLIHIFTLIERVIHIIHDTFKSHISITEKQYCYKKHLCIKNLKCGIHYVKWLHGWGHNINLIYLQSYFLQKNINTLFCELHIICVILYYLLASTSCVEIGHRKINVFIHQTVWQEAND